MAITELPITVEKEDKLNPSARTSISLAIHPGSSST